MSWLEKFRDDPNRIGIFFTDQMLTVHFDGTIDNTPQGLFWDLGFIKISELEPRNQKNLKILLNDWFVDGQLEANETAENIQLYLNDHMAHKANAFLQTKHAFEALFKEPVLISPTFLDLCHLICKANNVKDYENRIQKQIGALDQLKTNREVREAQGRLYDGILERLKHVPSAEDSAVIKSEMAMVLKDYGLEVITPDGQWPHIFSDHNKEQLATLLKQRLDKAASSVDQTIVQMRKQVGRTTLTEDNAHIQEQLFRLSHRAPRDIAMLFDLVLQDSGISVFLTNTPGIGEIYPAYGASSASGGYSVIDRMIYMPKKECTSCPTYEEALGKPLKGLFACLNKRLPGKLPEGMSMRCSPVEVWSEELLHAAIHKLFENESLPYAALGSGEEVDRQSRHKQSKLRRAMIRDFKNNPELINHMQAYIHDPKLAYSPEALAEALANTDNKDLFELLAKELPVKIMVEATRHGWARGEKLAPEVADFIRADLVAAAERKCAEEGIKQTRKKTSHERVPFEVLALDRRI